MSKCTWAGCNEEAMHAWNDKKGNVWASLCPDHNDSLQESIDKSGSIDPEEMKQGLREVLSKWIKAQGGAKVAARRVLKG